MSKIKPDPQVWLKQINKMIDDPEFSFAKDYLIDVRDQIEEKNFITTDQTTGIMNIRRSKK